MRIWMRKNKRRSGRNRKIGRSFTKGRKRISMNITYDKKKWLRIIVLLVIANTLSGRLTNESMW